MAGIFRNGKYIARKRSGWSRLFYKKGMSVFQMFFDCNDCSDALNHHKRFWRQTIVIL